MENAVAFIDVKEEIAEVVHLIPQDPAEARTAVRAVGVAVHPRRVNSRVDPLHSVG